MTRPTPQHSFNWSLIQTFIAVFDTSSMLGAARLLGAQQPTVSRQIAELEQQLGVPLFERTGRGVSPTAAALVLIDAARGMNVNADQLLRALSQESVKTKGLVKITASELAASFLLPSICAEFAAIEPDIQITIVATNRVSNLLRRDADIAVRMVRPEQGSLIAKKLGELRIVACAHESYLALHGTPIRPHDLLNHRLIGYDLDNQIVRGFADAGVPITSAHFGVRTDHQNVYTALIQAGAGIGFIDSQTIRHLNGVVPLLNELKIPSLPCWLAVHREIHGNPLVRKVYDYLAQSITTQLQD